MQENHSTEVTSVLVNDLLKEKRADRRWRNIRFFLWFAFIVYIAWNVFDTFNNKPALTSATTGVMGGKYIALVRLNGMIAPDRDFSAEDIIPVLYDAFSDKNVAGIVINVNSPGGTPVQAAIIHDAILSFKKKYKKKVVVVGEDMLTSGAYYVAVAADKIYVNPNTITGSIGVVMKSFGFVDLMKKIGVERRVYAIGNDKDRLDPFLPQNPSDVKKIQEVMNEVQANFTKAVLEGRKGKLKAEPSTLFTGDFWSGQTALKLGLVDNLGTLMDVSEKEFDGKEYKEFTNEPALFRMLGVQLNSAMDSVFYRYV